MSDRLRSARDRGKLWGRLEAMLRRFERFGLRALQRLPDRALSRLGGGAPVVVEGRRLDPLIQVMLRLSRVPPIERMPAPKARRV